MTDVLEDVVKVLYDYSYTDDRGPIDIKRGDVYRLVEKTNEEWWQVYNPSSDNLEYFFVPAQYVEIVSEISPWRTLSDLDKTLLDFESSRPSHSPPPDYDRGKGVRRAVTTEANGEPEGDYINLADYRNAAGIPNLTLTPDSQPSNPSPTPKPVIPQELLQGTIPPPLPEEGTFVKILLEGIPWDIYKEHTAGRLFYVNRETHERMWKPPRKEKVTTPSTSTELSRGSNPQSPSSPLTPSSKKEEWSGVPSEYEQVHDNGSIYFIHKSTQEKWKTIVDKVGRHYFHKLGTTDTQWDLPSAPSSNREIDCDAVYSNRSVEKPSDVNWESHGHRLSTFGEPSSRATKAMSTYGLLESSSSYSRASTLPANFTVARPAPVAPSIIERSGSLTSTTPPSSLTASNSSGSLQANDEVFGSYLNRAKLTDLGGKRKSKKNWAQVYVVLQGSNLIFYKDQKAASQKPGSPHGRPDGVISLQGAHITFNPPKEITSKKNTLLLTSKTQIFFLFNSESEKLIREWWTRMKLVANDITPDFSVKEPEDKKGFSRSVSVDETSSLQAMDKNRNIIGLKAKLRNFISGRPSKEDLVKQGIIKDTIFGSVLSELCDREKVAVPKFVHTCIQAVEARGLKQDGLYRVSGNMAQIQKLRYAVDKDSSYDLYDEQWDINVLTGALKLFFRELKEPVFPFHMYQKFIEAILKNHPKEQFSAFKSAVSNLPRCNYYTLKELFQHLCRVITLCQVNRMQAQNVAIVFGPTLLWQECSADSLAVQTVYQSRIVEYILLKFDDLFK